MMFAKNFPKTMDTVDGEKSCPGDESIAIVYKASSTPSVAGFVLLIDID